MKKNESWNSILDNLKVDYLKALEERILLLSDLTQKKDIESLENEYHKLKGTGKTYGFPAVSEICNEMERITRENKTVPEHLLTAGPALLQYCLEAFRSTGSLNLEIHPDYISIKNAKKT
jgi:chemotaxis protein histidine kinase CheA